MNKWISTKKQLPQIYDCKGYDSIANEHYGPFLCTLDGGAAGRYVTKLCFRPERNLWYRNGSDMESIDSNKIIAWKNLPRPYMGE